MPRDDLETLRYPIGRYAHDGPVTGEELRLWLDQLEALPAEFRAAVEPLTDAQLDTRYRPGGWTLRQVVHHLPDSHLNAYVRSKWTLTEETPRIKTYYEERWAELADARGPVGTSLDLLAAVHARWLSLLGQLVPGQWARPLDHPEFGTVALDWLIGMYAWHGRHHLAHVTSTVEREGW